jgi:hypothetical protein
VVGRGGQRASVRRDRAAFPAYDLHRVRVVLRTFPATMLAADVPVSSDLTRALLGWEPTHESLLEDLRFGDYITGPLSQP